MRQAGVGSVKEKIADIEKRHSPRFEVDLPVEALGIKGRLVNLSDEGFSLSFPKPISQTEFLISLRLPSSSIQLRMQTKWNSKTGIDGWNLYGVAIDQSDKAALNELRKYLVMRQFRATAKGKNKKIRSHILIFAKEFLNYLKDLKSMSERLRSRSLDDVAQLELQQHLADLSNEIIKKGEGLKSDIDSKVVMDQIKQDFRKLVSCWAFKSQIMKRGFDKPKGYPGDYRTLEVIYDHEIFSSPKELGYYFDRYFLNNPYADAVRNRKDTLKDILKQTLIKKPGPIKILNIACGSCREIRELFQSPDKELLGKSIEFTCIDWDEDALQFSKTEIEKVIPPNVTLDMVKENVMNFVKDAKFFDTKGKYDLIYSIGLADYLPDRVIKRMTKNVHLGLKPKGEFLIAHKDKELSFSHLPPEWFCDWTFYPRNEQEMKELMQDVGVGRVLDSVIREPSQQVFFITLRKE